MTSQAKQSKSYFGSLFWQARCAATPNVRFGWKTDVRSRANFPGRPRYLDGFEYAERGLAQPVCSQYFSRNSRAVTSAKHLSPPICDNQLWMSSSAFFPGWLRLFDLSRYISIARNLASSESPRISAAFAIPGSMLVREISRSFVDASRMALGLSLRDMNNFANSFAKLRSSSRSLSVVARLKRVIRPVVIASIERT